MQRSNTFLASLCCALAMTFVGSSVAVSGLLDDAPYLTAQALRYAAASAILLLLARASGRSLTWPRGAEWAWLLGITVLGLVLFNVALILGAAHAEPAVLGTAVACVPLLLALVGPALEGRRPTRSLVFAAIVVTLGAVLVEGLGHADAVGLGLAVVVLLCEACFTLMAVPVLARHGAWGVSTHATWLAAVAFGVLGVGFEGPRAIVAVSRDDVIAVVFLAVGVTAAAFLLWYTGVSRLGASRAGLFTGIAPIAAAFTGVLLGRPIPDIGVWVGTVVVACGLALGLYRTSPATDPTTQPDSVQVPI